jgi:hypothetical protein
VIELRDWTGIALRQKTRQSHSSKDLATVISEPDSLPTGTDGSSQKRAVTTLF